MQIPTLIVVPGGTFHDSVCLHPSCSARVNIKATVIQLLLIMVAKTPMEFLLAKWLFTTLKVIECLIL